ncbi:MAG TPA: nucleoside hydrolase [Kineosporiaceae bacterium]
MTPAPDAARIPVVLDVETGIDDACALLLAARHPALDLRAVSCVVGNAPVEPGGPEHAHRARRRRPGHRPGGARGRASAAGAGPAAPARPRRGRHG